LRQKTDLQQSIFDIIPEHNIGRELKAISDFIDQCSTLVERVHQDLSSLNVKDTGRTGFTSDQVLRFAFLKQYTGFSYRELSFYLQDSETFKAFSRCWKKSPSSSSLQSLISSIKASTWEHINRQILERAVDSNIEKGRVTRTDSTITETHIHKPTDNELLLDSVRVMARLLKQAEKLSKVRFSWRNRIRVCKKLSRLIRFSPKKDHKKLYRQLVSHTEKMWFQLADIQTFMCTFGVHDENKFRTWSEEVENYLDLAWCVIEQTDWRVFKGIKVSAKDKIFSIFEDHTDLIVKGNRQIQYGHKLNLTTGKSGLVIDLVIEDGNPTDSQTTLKMLQRQVEIYKRPPRQVSLDGGYASKANLEHAKELGIKDVAFHKKRGLNVPDMVKSNWVYKKLRAFRAGIEGNIATLKDRFNLRRCNWKGLDRFKAYVWSSVVAYNLVTLARKT